MGNYDKGGALNEVKKIMGLDRSVVTIALGDSPNDQAMLNNADVAVVIPSSHAKDIVITNPIQIIYAENQARAAGSKPWIKFF